MSHPYICERCGVEKICGMAGCSGQHCVPVCPDDLKDAAAVSLGRKGGQAKSDAKTAAARENGRKGAEARWKDHKAKGKKR